MGVLRTVVQVTLGPFKASEYELEIEVEYTVHPGCRASHWQPAEDATVEINIIKVLAERETWWPATFLGALIEDDEELHRLCLEDWRIDQIHAEELRAEQRREERMLREWEA